MIVRNNEEFEKLEIGKLMLCQELTTNNNVFVMLKETSEAAKKFGERLELDYCAGGVGTSEIQIFVILFKIKDKIYDLFIDFSHSESKDLLAKFIVLDKFKFVIETESGSAISELNNVLKEKLKDAYTNINNIYRQKNWTKSNFIKIEDMIRNQYSNYDLWSLLTK